MAHVISVGDFEYATIDAKGAPVQNIGKGAYGTVYKGVNKKTGEPVAVKLINNNDVHMNKFLDNELLIHRKLSHPNLVRCYEVDVRRHISLESFQLS